MNKILITVFRDIGGKAGTEEAYFFVGKEQRVSEKTGVIVSKARISPHYFWKLDPLIPINCKIEIDLPVGCCISASNIAWLALISPAGDGGRMPIAECKFHESYPRVIID